MPVLTNSSRIPAVPAEDQARAAAFIVSHQQQEIAAEKLSAAKQIAERCLDALEKEDDHEERIRLARNAAAEIGTVTDGVLGINDLKLTLLIWGLSNKLDEINVAAQKDAATDLAKEGGLAAILPKSGLSIPEGVDRDEYERVLADLQEPELQAAVEKRLRGSNIRLTADNLVAAAGRVAEKGEDPTDPANLALALKQEHYRKAIRGACGEDSELGTPQRISAENAVADQAAANGGCCNCLVEEIARTLNARGLDANKFIENVQTATGTTPRAFSTATPTAAPMGAK